MQDLMVRNAHEVAFQAEYLLSERPVHTLPGVELQESVQSPIGVPLMVNNRTETPERPPVPV